MNQSPTVMKFGGTSVEDAHAFERVARIVLARADENPVVVVSAMCRVTDALLTSFRAVVEGGKAVDAADQLEEHYDRHRAVARALLSAEEAKAFEKTLEYARCEVAAFLYAAASREEDRMALQDAVVSYGEQLSAALLAYVLRRAGLVGARYVEARRCIITDDQFGQAEPDMVETVSRTREEVLPVIEAGGIPVLGGFIAATHGGEMTTTLGRGGSDYTAAIVGAALQAREIQIWTDVSGVLTADPRVVAGARSIPRLSYAEAAELAYFGAKVLHPKTILPAVVRGIPVRICNSREPESESTVINFDTDATPHTVKAIAHKKNVSIVHVTSARMLGAYGFLRALFEVFDRHRVVVDLVTTSEVSVSLSLESTHALDEVVADLQSIGAVKVEHGRALICVVGDGLRDARGLASKIFTAVRDINVMLISQGASSINLTFVVDEAHAEKAVCQLHEAFFEQNTRELYQTAAADD